MRFKDYLFGGLYKDIFPGAQEMLWQGFKAQCAAEGNWLPWLIYSMEPQSTGMFKRTRQRRPKRSAIFDDLPLAQQATAQKTFDRLCAEWSWRVRTGTAQSAAPSNWRKPLLAGVARRLATNPSRVPTGVDSGSRGA
jgi:hypothetical protein